MSLTRGTRQFQVEGYGFTPQNYLINGGFEVWQRGTTFTPSNTFTADEWWSVSGGGTPTVARNASPKIGVYCLSMQNTGSLGIDIRQGIECFKQLEGLTVTLSVWMKSSAGADVRAIIQDYTGVQEDVSVYYTGGGDWQRVTVVKTIRAGLSAIGPTNFPHRHSIMVQLYSAQGVQTFIDGAMLVVGNYPEGVPFIPKSPEEDFRDCQRFYEIYGGSAAGIDICPLLYGLAGNSYGSCAQFQSPKAAVPTITKVGTWAVSNSGQPIVASPSVNGYYLYATAIANGLAYFYNANANCYITAEVP